MKFNLKNQYLNYKAKLFNSSIKEMTKKIEMVKTRTLKGIINEKKWDSIYNKKNNKIKEEFSRIIHSKLPENFDPHDDFNFAIFLKYFL